jgi:hopene-associated glycosyltransferase HpnB
MITGIAALSFVVWLYLLLFRGGYWLSSVRDDTVSDAPPARPHIVAVIPARNEADCIAASIGSLLAQDYAGRFSIVLVDDNSEDATAAIAERLVREAPKVPLTVLRGAPLPEGWTGKLWAVKQGIAEASKDAPDFLLLTDADIVYEPQVVSWLASHAVSGRYVLTSLMAKLRCESFAERAFIPAFIYFFQMLYPFRWVNTPHKALAAAAGGCMLVKADALARAGGIEAIRDALIDDCTLGKVMKEQGPIWLGLTGRVRSIRPSVGIADIHAMVSRSAYAQLRYSPLLLALTIAGMALTYWVAPLAAIFGDGPVRLLGLGTWILMIVTFWPTLRFYGLSALWGLALPAIATAYMAFTLSSALQHILGRGGRWKGRNQARMHNAGMKQVS